MHLAVFDATVELDETAIAESSSTILAQLRDYLAGDRRAFDLTVAYPAGTRGDVLRVVSDVPYGETRPYAAIAADLGTAPVVVGTACAHNPVPVVVPCHRVVGSDGSLRGYAASDGVATKRRLLALEREARGPAGADVPTD